jgi:hypothetical protein
MQRYHRKQHLAIWIVLTALIGMSLYCAFSHRPEVPFQNPPSQVPQNQ